ncbi:hypothetical protein CYMTET_15044 [Cymbomonas tetramitiformis]|uniref:Uncharacterized protein n=1 Tax=Cymbomonas tetramitiformis TaxID=36881 RepID=A0AAE0GFA4_9CHLO|nr:hypothetical protein CYMTET_15044 [Cymbomonas tetramitiformis]
MNDSPHQACLALIYLVSTAEPLLGPCIPSTSRLFTDLVVEGHGDGGAPVIGALSMGFFSTEHEQATDILADDTDDEDPSPPPQNARAAPHAAAQHDTTTSAPRVTFARRGVGAAPFGSDIFLTTALLCIVLLSACGINDAATVSVLFRAPPPPGGARTPPRGPPGNSRPVLGWSPPVPEGLADLLRTPGAVPTAGLGAEAGVDDAEQVHRMGFAGVSGTPRPSPDMGRRLYVGPLFRPVEEEWCGHSMCSMPPTGVVADDGSTATFSWVFCPLILDANPSGPNPHLQTTAATLPGVSANRRHRPHEAKQKGTNKDPPEL